MDDPHIERTTEEARAGATPGIVRWVLLISLSLAVLSLGLVALVGMARRNPYPPPPQETGFAQPALPASGSPGTAPAPAPRQGT